MPRRLLEAVGVTPSYKRTSMTAAGRRETTLYDTVQAEIQGRIANIDPDDCPVLVGQLVLETMDWVIDMKNHKLIGNPAHGGEAMLEVWSIFPDEGA